MEDLEQMDVMETEDQDMNLLQDMEQTDCQIQEERGSLEVPAINNLSATTCSREQHLLNHEITNIFEDVNKIFISDTIREDVSKQMLQNHKGLVNNNTFDYHNYVNLPCETNLMINGRERSSSTIKQSKWLKIEKTMKKLIEGIDQKLQNISNPNILKQCISRYCAEARYCNFEVWDTFWTEENSIISYSQKVQTLRAIADSVLKLPDVFMKRKIMLLSSEKNAKLELSQKDIYHLLASAFMCTFPKRGPHHYEYENYPSINFIGLYHKNLNRPSAPKVEKLNCFFNYFHKMSQHINDESYLHNLIFERRCLHQDDIPNWENLNCKLTQAEMLSRGSIFMDTGKIQVDFANKLIGGGILGNGAVMEEILFAVCPELVVSRLFTEQLEDREALVIYGAEQFSKYNGYGSSFLFTGSHYDGEAKKLRKIVAIDALRFHRSKTWDEFHEMKIVRELNKCYVAFRNHSLSPSNFPKLREIASGKWGCGSFNGDPLLKNLIQIMAASASTKDISLYTFGDGNLCQNVNTLMQHFHNNNMTIGKLFKLLIQFSLTQQGFEPPNLHEYLLRHIKSEKQSIPSAEINNLEHWYPHESKKCASLAHKKVSYVPESFNTSWLSDQTLRNPDNHSNQSNVLLSNKTLTQQSEPGPTSFWRRLLSIHPLLQRIYKLTVGDRHKRV